MARRGERVEVTIAAVDRIAAPIRRVNRTIEGMLRPIRRVRSSLSALGRELHLSALRRGLGAAFRGLQSLGLAAGVAAAAVLEGVRRIAVGGDELAKFTRQIKFGVEAFQEYEFAADRSGVSSETFRASIGALSKRVGELKAGKGALATLLGDVDPSFKAALAATTDTEEALDLVIQRLEQLPDPAKRSALAAAAFSRAGLEMIRLADAGSEELARLRDRARELGFAFDDGAARQAEATVDALTDLKAAALGVARQVAVQLFPAIQDVAHAVTAWIVANREWLRSSIADGVRELVAEGRTFGKWLLETIPKVVQFVREFQHWKPVLVALGVVLAASIVAPIVGLIALIGPWGAALVAIGAGVVAFWDDIYATIKPVLDALEQANDFVSTYTGRGIVQNLVASSPIGLAAQGAAATYENAGGLVAGFKGLIGIEVDDKRTRVTRTEFDQPGLQAEADMGIALGAEG